jgi:hypothetical protein
LLLFLPLLSLYGTPRLPFGLISFVATYEEAFKSIEVTIHQSLSFFFGQ